MGIGKNNGYNIGIGYNPFTENITGTNNIGIGYGRYSLGNTFMGFRQKTYLGHITTQTEQSATITASNQMVLGTSGVL
jgi:hypothetical protein